MTAPGGTHRHLRLQQAVQGKPLGKGQLESGSWERLRRIPRPDIQAKGPKRSIRVDEASGGIILIERPPADGGQGAANTGQGMGSTTADVAPVPVMDVEDR